MGRFLIYFSYLGQRYSGVQTQKIPIVKGRPILTVQDALHSALRHLRPANEVKVILSSRTDKGVHALKNSCHVDLCYPAEGKEYNPEVITQVVNYFLCKKSHEIRVLETQQVPETFHSRMHTQSRRYVYRLGYRVQYGNQSAHTEGLNTDVLAEVKKYALNRKVRFFKTPTADDSTSLDAYKVSMLSYSLDTAKLHAAAELLSGIHDFRAFSSESSIFTKSGRRIIHPVKLLTIGVRRGQPLAFRLQQGVCRRLDDYEFWDIHVESRSFLYRMVRRLVGAMILHAKGKISLDDIQDILVRPRHDFPFAPGLNAPETGLFLQDIIYNPKDLEFPGTSRTEQADSETGTTASDSETESLDDGTHSSETEKLSEPDLPHTLVKEEKH